MNESKRLKLICCDVFARLAYAAIARAERVVDAEFLPMLSHTEPSKLRSMLQQRIDNTDPAVYGKLLLGYCLCGNATAGLSFPVPAVMPRAHDCCAVFMGSQSRFLAEFGDGLSTRWCTCGYYERGRYDSFFEDGFFNTNPEYIKLAQEYGEDNAEYVWHTLHPAPETSESVYIRIDGYEYGGTEALYRKETESAGKTLRTIQGDASWFFRLVNGPWDNEGFLLINPGKSVEAVYDMREVVRAV